MFEEMAAVQAGSFRGTGSSGVGCGRGLLSLATAAALRCCQVLRQNAGGATGRSGGAQGPDTFRWLQSRRNHARNHYWNYTGGIIPVSECQGS